MKFYSLHWWLRCSYCEWTVVNCWRAHGGELEGRTRSALFVSTSVNKYTGYGVPWEILNCEFIGVPIPRARFLAYNFL